MNRSLSALLFTLTAIPVLAQISAPKIGIARYPDGSLHTVQGLPSNMIVADLLLGTAQAASFSDHGGIIFQEGRIRLLGADLSTLAEYPSSETPLVAIDSDLTSALAWLPVAHTLLHWNGSQFESVSLDGPELEGSITNLRSSSARQAILIVQHTDQSVSSVTVSLRTGNLVSAETLPGVRGYAFGQGFFVVFAADKQLVADDLRGYRRTLPVPASDFVIERMSTSWLHLYSPSLKQNWALHLTHADLDLSLLPGLPEAMAANKETK